MWFVLNPIYRGIVVVLAFVAILSNFGFNVAALVAGLGVGGIAVALAAQKTIENLFGGLKAERVREISEKVQRWRESNEIYLPNFPAAKIEELKGTLPYPPEGSPGYRGTSF